VIIAGVWISGAWLVSGGMDSSKLSASWQTCYLQREIRALNTIQSPPRRPAESRQALGTICRFSLLRPLVPDTFRREGSEGHSARKTADRRRRRGSRISSTRTEFGWVVVEADLWPKLGSVKAALHRLSWAWARSRSPRLTSNLREPIFRIHFLASRRSLGRRCSGPNRLLALANSRSATSGMFAR